MSRKRGKRKPHPINPLAYQAAIMGACKMTTHDTSRRAIAVGLAVEDAAKGLRGMAHWREIFDAINITGELVRAGVAQDPAGNIAHLEAMAVAMMERFKALGSATLYAGELQQLREFAADYAGLLQGVSNGEFFNACAKVEARVRRVLSGEVMPCVSVVEAAGW